VRAVSFVSKGHSLFFVVLLQAACSAQEPYVDKLLVGGVLRPQLRQAPVDSGLAALCRPTAGGAAVSRFFSGNVPSGEKKTIRETSFREKNHPGNDRISKLGNWLSNLVALFIACV